jgi:hypothetical protein
VVLGLTQEVRIDGSKSNRDKTAIRNDIKSSNNEIQSLSIEISELNTKIVYYQILLVNMKC